MGLYELKMPKTGESVTEGTIMEFRVQEGDRVEQDDVLFEISTAKVSAEVPSPVDGVIKEILFEEGDVVPVGQVVMKIEVEGEMETEAPTPTEEQRTETPATESASKSEVPTGRWYSPVVKSLAKQAKISDEELDKIPGTGFEGRLSKKDIMLYIDEKNGLPRPEQRPAAPTATERPQHTPERPQPRQAPVLEEREGDTIIPMDAVRRVIAERMVESVQISPHVTSVIEVDVTNLVRWREEKKETFKRQEGVSLTYMAPILQATAKALKAFSRVNASVSGHNIVEHRDINIGMAVSMDDGNLIVPVIKGGDRLSISGLAHQVSDLAKKARGNKLSMDDISGGTFTVTNYGSFGSLFGTPIINQPEVAILGVGTIQKKPAVLETPDGDVIAIRHKMYLALAVDHRIIDGALAGQFLSYMAEILENWKDE